ncbi:hypothetical protein [Burkholderia sp. PAMC 26561]|uniref:hypothetical protein n=1 Tax=Burkholderia sp. PAMC 26561 TaxID=1795043 RepID=UPI00076B4956|nr:hypothetical protein [Burkholderia sp. PAMC 26561]AME28660.1 hypothetical protein AXG89_33260 [Burkholderia sp. PAMC 26561]
MALSLIRGLTTSVVRNFASLKRDAKRLQKHSQQVFGTSYPLTTCQHAIAVSRGFKSLADIERLGSRLGLERNAPFWTIQSRNDTHQEVLEAIYRLELEVSENGPVAMLGKQAHAILPALVLFFEEMSFKKMPGLLLIETGAQAVQDTLVATAIAQLGMEATFEGFRALDLRETALPVALDTGARYWVSALMYALPERIRKQLNSIGWDHDLELAAEANAVNRLQVFGPADFSTIPFYSIKSIASSVAGAAARPAWMEEGAGPFVAARQLSSDTSEALDRALELIYALDARKFNVGVSAVHESSRRPYVALFSRDDPASVVLASVLHSFFSARYAKPELRDRRPAILYVSDRAEPYAPECLQFGNHTVIVNGLKEVPSGTGAGEFYGYKDALKVRATPEGIQFMGTRVSVPLLSLRSETT